ncbi:hypothetical protein NM208_g12087 [Fusarium decemcellulare]|uniref:Uncharacterized protein n=1 Tax=Fusarium decemcellulare TaxID=57161 RepID=A0ACC1RQ01_9HYPO|nr:hypothetical protein NM208_g12087 [Fusarium decemcellulare]
MSPQQRPKKQRGSKEKKKKQESAMLEIWLNEPRDVVSAPDVWSSEQALARQRQIIKSDDDSRQHQNEDGDTANAA